MAGLIVNSAHHQSVIAETTIDGLYWDEELAFSVTHTTTIVTTAWNLAAPEGGTADLVESTVDMTTATLRPEKGGAWVVTCLVNAGTANQALYPVTLNVLEVDPSTPVYGHRLVAMDPANALTPTSGHTEFSNVLTGFPGWKDSAGTVHEATTSVTLAAGLATRLRVTGVTSTAAAACVSAQSDGTTVQLLRTAYPVTSTLTLTAALAMQGDGPTCNLAVNTGTAAHGISAGSGTSLKLRHHKLSSTDCLSGIRDNGSSGIDVEDVAFSAVGTNKNFCAIKSDASTKLEVRRARFSGCGYAGTETGLNALLCCSGRTGGAVHSGVVIEDFESDSTNTVACGILLFDVDRPKFGRVHLVYGPSNSGDPQPYGIMHYVTSTGGECRGPQGGDLYLEGWPGSGAYFAGVNGGALDRVEAVRCGKSQDYTSLPVGGLSITGEASVATVGKHIALPMHVLEVVGRDCMPAALGASGTVLVERCLAEGKLNRRGSVKMRGVRIISGGSVGSSLQYLRSVDCGAGLEVIGTALAPISNMHFPCVEVESSFRTVACTFNVDGATVQASHYFGEEYEVEFVTGDTLPTGLLNRTVYAVGNSDWNGRDDVPGTSLKIYRVDKQVLTPTTTTVGNEIRVAVMVNSFRTLVRYTVQAGDTLTTICTALAALIGAVTNVDASVVSDTVEITAWDGANTYYAGGAYYSLDLEELQNATAARTQVTWVGTGSGTFAVQTAVNRAYQGAALSWEYVTDSDAMVRAHNQNGNTIYLANCQRCRIRVRTENPGIGQESSVYAVVLTNCQDCEVHIDVVGGSKVSRIVSATGTSTRNRYWIRSDTYAASQIGRDDEMVEALYPGPAQGTAQLDAGYCTIWTPAIVGGGEQIEVAPMGSSATFMGQPRVEGNVDTTNHLFQVVSRIDAGTPDTSDNRNIQWRVRNQLNQYWTSLPGNTFGLLLSGRDRRTVSGTDLQAWASILGVTTRFVAAGGEEPTAGAYTNVFDGATAKMTSSSTLANLIGAGHWCIVGHINVNDTTYDGSTPANADTILDSADVYYLLGVRSQATPKVYAYLYDTGNREIELAITEDTDYIVCNWFDGTNMNLSLTKVSDGVVTTGTPVACGAPGATTGTLEMGGHSTGLKYTGQIGDLMCVQGTFVTGNRDALISFLRDRVRQSLA